MTSHRLKTLRSESAAGWRLPSLSLLVLLLANSFGAARVAAVADAGAMTCPMNETKDAPVDARLDAHGVLRSDQTGRSYQPSEYRKIQNGYVLCTCTKTKPCIRKCCKLNRAYVTQKTGRFKCSFRNVSSETDGDFAVPKFVNASGMIGSYEKDRFHLTYGLPKCPNGEIFRINPIKSNNTDDDFLVSEEGWLLNKSGIIKAPPDNFCLEQFSDSNFQISLYWCDEGKPPEQQNKANINLFFIMTGVLLSLPFLTITFLVYALIRELRNLHGKSLMCHVASLLVAYTSLVTTRLATNIINGNGCLTLAYTMQFSFLASFFWLNVMCFDLWWTFSRIRPQRGNLHDIETKKFIYYSIYAWGCSSLISMVTYCKQSWSNLLPNLVSPGFGKDKCWFSSKLSTMVYFYGPIGVLLFSNLLMFIYTAIMIIKHMKERKLLNRRDSQTNINHDKQRFVLYLKLFIVMGVNWLAEILSWVLEPEGATGSLWTVTDIGNALQGVFIFIIFVCKKRVLKLLSKKLNLNCFSSNSFNTESIKTTHITSSKFSSKTKDVVEMNSVNAQNSTSNQYVDVKF